MLEMKWLLNRKVCVAVCLIIAMYMIKWRYFSEPACANGDGIHLLKTSYPSNTVCLCIRLHERLGNHLYMIASAYSLAKSKGMELCVTGNADNITSVFNIPETFTSRSSLCDNFNNTVKETGCSKLSEKILHLSADEPVLVSGYLQNYRYFEKNKKDIKKIFSFREHTLHAATDKLEELLRERLGDQQESELFDHTLVGVHIRRGDLLTPYFKEFGYRVATKEYLFKAQNYMRTSYPKVMFIVCSEDVNWSKQFFSDQSDVIVAPRGSAVVDMALLTLMDHTVITVGTFGYWSAWLNPQNGTVIYFKDFVTPNSSLSRNFDLPYTDIYYPYWIGM